MPRAQISRLGPGIFKSRTFLCCCWAIACKEQNRTESRRKLVVSWPPDLSAALLGLEGMSRNYHHSTIA